VACPGVNQYLYDNELSSLSSTIQSMQSSSITVTALADDYVSKNCGLDIKSSWRVLDRYDEMIVVTDMSFRRGMSSTIANSYPRMKMFPLSQKP
jgi:hypothetical protein